MVAIQRGEALQRMACDLPSSAFNLRATALLGVAGKTWNSYGAHEHDSYQQDVWQQGLRQLNM